MPSAADNISNCDSASSCRVTWACVVILDSQAMLCEYKMLFKANYKSFLSLVTMRVFQCVCVSVCLWIKFLMQQQAIPNVSWIVSHLFLIALWYLEWNNISETLWTSLSI